MSDYVIWVTDECKRVRRCGCGFCKTAFGQCTWGDCHRPATVGFTNYGRVCTRHVRSVETTIGQRADITRVA